MYFNRYNENFDSMLKNEISKGIVKYILAIIILIPGYVLKEYVLIPWYIIPIFFLLLKRIDLIIQILLLWIFLFAGAYQYHLIGNSLDNFLVKYLNIYLSVCLIIAFVLLKKDKYLDFSKVSRFGLAILIVILISAIANAIQPLDIWVGIVTHLKWFIIMYVLAKTRIDNNNFEKIINLFTGILIVNSVIGFSQQLLLPAQTTPDGYTPQIEDVASGFLGATAGPQLTNLCLVLASYYIIRYISMQGKINFVIASLLLLQPFISESKAALLSGIIFFLVSIISIIYYSRFTVIKVDKTIRYLIILALILSGTYLYNLSKKDFKYNYSTTAIFQNYFHRGLDLTDFAKVEGYIDSFTIIAPHGKLGIFFGIGPNQFKNELRLVSSLGFDFDQGNKISSINFKITEIIILISDLGLIGFIIFIWGTWGIYLFFIKKTKHSKNMGDKILALMISQFILVAFFNSFYWMGWFNQLYYFPLSIYLVYFIKRDSYAKLQAN